MKLTDYLLALRKQAVSMLFRADRVRFVIANFSCKKEVRIQVALFERFGSAPLVCKN
jgi:hypothetical protein